MWMHFVSFKWNQYILGKRKVHSGDDSLKIKMFLMQWLINLFECCCFLLQTAELWKQRELDENLWPLPPSCWTCSQVTGPSWQGRRRDGVTYPSTPADRGTPRRRAGSRWRERSRSSSDSRGRTCPPAQKKRSQRAQSHRGGSLLRHRTYDSGSAGSEGGGQATGSVKTRVFERQPPKQAVLTFDL